MRYYFHWITCLLLVMLVFPAIGQVPLGVNPPSLKWQQINTDRFQVIFPVSRQSEGQRVANILNRMSQDNKLSLGVTPEKVSMILQNQTTLANGFVTLQPWRSELFLNPPQFQFANNVPWLDLVAIHEFRHVQQISTARNGTPGKIASTLFGQGGWALNAFAIQPRWFLEGDAVYAETLLTNGGRGRSPDFEREYRAMRLSGLKYNYEKAGAFSIKDFVPNHYHLGYFMTTYARRKYGDDIWDKVLGTTYKGIGLYRFSRSLKKQTGLNTKQLYKETMQDLDSVWADKDEDLKLVEGVLVTQESKTYTNYRLPQFLDDKTLVARKSSLKEIAGFYKIDIATGTETRITRPGVSLGQALSANAGSLAWAEITFHPRWEGKDYSIIRTYDLQSGTKRKLSFKSKLFTPALSPSGDQIVAIESTPDGKYHLVLIDAISGAVIKTLSNTDNSFLSFPKWTPDGQSIIYLAQNDEGNVIRATSPVEGGERDISPYSGETIGRLAPDNQRVYFSASFTGTQNTYALNYKSGAISQVTSSRWGAYFPAISPDGKTLAYSDYTAKGYQLRTLTLDPANFLSFDQSSESEIDYYKPLLGGSTKNILEDLPNETYPVSKFNQWTKGLFNIHSWVPVVTFEEYGLQLQSDNIMRTLSAVGQVTYNTDNSNWKTLGRVSYGALFPIFDFEVSTGRRTTDIFTQVDSERRLVPYIADWRENVFSGGIRVPLNLTHGNHISNLTLSSNYQQYKVNYFDTVTDRRRNEYFGAIELGLSFYRLQTTARQNINPRFGQILNVTYNDVLTQSANQGKKFTTSATLFFPGFFRNHSFYVSGAYQKEDIVNAFRFEDTFIQARGYSSSFYESLYKVSANYSLPLLYPDLALSSLFFIRRVKANFFYDYSEGTILEVNKFVESSAGVELSSDFRFLRLIELDLGVRLGVQFEADRRFANFIFLGISF